MSAQSAAQPAAERPARGPFDVWAPRCDRVRLSLAEDVVDMVPADGGWWTPASVPAGVPDGTSYGFLLGEDTTVLPDPRSRRQPGGVHERSATFDAGAHTWTDAGWTGRQLAGATIYELHVGTFSPAGTFDGVVERLDHLVSLGVGFVELMPVNAFNGVHNWGYDGVLWSAVHEPYGGPAGYQRLVDACHRAGIGVIQDVVYNHLGPSGNYLPRFGPYLKQGRNTWGDLVNLDGEGAAEVRRYILDSALMWLRDYHVDGLRLDAVHALHDDSDLHLLEEMAIEVQALSAHLNRPLTLIAESDLNDTRLVTPREAGGYGLDAQWSDDFHHGVHVALTGETTGYYADFEPLGALGKVLDCGFFHDGTFSSFRDAPHGRPVDTERMPAWRLVVCAQNHDQIGNRARGDRTAEHLSTEQLLCGALLTLGSPFTPMLFQGEEWAASTPFAFFTSHPEPELATATAEGRLAEFERMGWDPDEVLDPQDPATFAASRLRWEEAETGEHARVLAGYRRLAQLRRTCPELTDPSFGSATVDEEARRLTLERGALAIHVNLGTEPWQVAATEVLFSTGSEPAQDSVPGGSVVVPGGNGVLVRR
ncbi:malto-oligosyltrehalose trehalohydrolase [Nocardioides sp. zg-536]|uniref:Malto-oligosyltrehalose trehalohydrolase n=1 Tax=Nocardioides faecalis TaxID=2803858 RepID=A0A938Y6M6_9ACTN|nr:malto-oligosyltrehalose trehalohydrolase [Nocardioides faecalis]MBM9460184.1 malto-oligosyltrehalose trehalohydrolase [Nocardioides faecalis]QVI60021.1 malto-oligosyltrehalose trehalohydrolase [Nocardioides faecalis]